MLCLLLLLACSDPAAPPDRPVSRAATKTAQLLTYRGGPTLPSASILNVYWGPGWLDPTWVDDKIAGLDSFAAGYGGSRYAAASNEYGGAQGPMTSSLAFLGSVIDSSPVAKLSGNPTNDRAMIAAQVCALHPSPAPNTIVNVYVDQPARGAYCAFHSTGLCGDTRVYFAFYWSLDNTSACQVPADPTGHSTGLGALANFTAHELSEARTDPLVGLGWLDANGSENADKCNDVFLVPFVTLANGSRWKVQALWSNAAYLASSGGRLDGCIPEAP